VGQHLIGGDGDGADLLLQAGILADVLLPDLNTPEPQGNPLLIFLRGTFSFSGSSASAILTSHYQVGVLVMRQYANTCYGLRARFKITSHFWAPIHPA
jgi:hypothetical protein